MMGGRCAACAHPFDDHTLPKPGGKIPLAPVCPPKVKA